MSISVKPITKKILEKFFKSAKKKLKGEWVLLGGSVLPSLGVQHRDTVDIDFVPTGDLSVQDQLKIFEISEELNLPAETINSAASIFLHRIKNYKSELIPLQQSENLTIFRPSFKLFILLKINRLSESDLQDCLKFTQLISKDKLYKNEIKGLKTLLHEIESRIETSDSEEKTRRLTKLADALKEI